MKGPLLITGGSGFIGRRVASLARQLGLNVLTPPRAVVDWRDAAMVQGYLSNHQPTAIIHLASSGVQSRDPNDPALIDAECQMMQLLLAYCGDGTSIIYGGSMAEYGQSGRLSEDMACMPRNAYAAAKLYAGTLLTEAIATGKCRGLHVRIFGAYGAGESTRRLFPQLLAALLKGERLRLSDGLQKRDFIHVDDVASALLHFAALEFSDQLPINLGTGRSVLVRDAVLAVAAEFGAHSSQFDFGAVPRSPHDQDMLEADTTRLALFLNPLPQQLFLSKENLIERLL